LALVPARYEFKFINGNDWPFAEDVPPTCQVEVNGNDNRYLYLSEATTFHTCWANCGACGHNAVRFMVDMTMEGGGSLNGVHVAGNFQNPDGDIGDWDPAAFQLNDHNSDNVFEGYYDIGTLTTFEYKFVNDDNWDTGMAENFSGACLTGGGNRTETVGAGSTVLPLYCFNSCDPCSEPVMITFNVDMTTSCLDYETEGLNLMGTLTNWGDGTPMTDDDNDNIYSLTLALQPGNYEYKFRVGGGGWEGGSNRTITVVAETPETLPNVCFGSADPCGTLVPAADVTFEVKEPVASPVGAGQSMWIMGDFTGWQSGALELADDDGDDIWTITLADFCPVEAFYKFVIGLDTLNTAEQWTEESADFTSIGGCGVDNGTFSDNRKLTRTDGNPVAVCYVFDTCDPCVVSVDETTLVSSLRVFPVPADDQLQVALETAQSTNLKIELINNVGQVVMSRQTGNIAGYQLITLQVDALAGGVYALRLSDGSKSVVRNVNIR
ncbi:MAG: T9SS type A sorting domain-containing protein, partial [Flavobacteriales bacterium]|nr:T9SS type A sorting domain-containing protein [Flavobacteriales bacterium]